MTDYRRKFSTSDRHRKLNQLRWPNISAHLTNETSNWRKKLLMYLYRAIYNVCDINIDPHVCFFPDIVTGSGPANPVSTARGLSTIQREACMRSLTTQKSKRLPRVLSNFVFFPWDYNDVIMGAMASQVASLTIVYSTVYSGADQTKY